MSATTPVYALPYQELTDPPHGPDLGRLLALAVEAELVRIDLRAAPGWTDWAASFAWTSSGTAPVKGNAVVVAEYRRPAGSDMVDVNGKITFGSTSNYGTGVYFFALPIAAHANMVGLPIGTGYALDAGTQEYGGIVKCQSTTTVRIMPASNSGDSGTNWGPTAPFTFAANDVLAFNVRYRTAS